MKFLLFFLLISSQVSLAHKEHRPDLGANLPLSGNSILQLGSAWKNQKGESINLIELRGKPRIVAMLFTNCDTTCPIIVEELKKIAVDIDAKQPSKVDVSIFSLDSSRETPESLSAFSAKRNLPPHWMLLTSNADAVAELAASLGVRYKQLQNGDFIHSNTIYLLNSNGEVVAQKEGLNSPRADFIEQIRRNR